MGRPRHLGRSVSVEETGDVRGDLLPDGGRSGTSAVCVCRSDRCNIDLVSGVKKMVWNIFGVIGLAVTLLLLGAGAWVWAVVVRNAYTAFLSARASTTIPHNANVVLPGVQIAMETGKLVAFGDATAHAVHPVNDEVN